MHDTSADDAVDLLESLGLKEYEARCFVALSRVDAATAKAVSDLSDVPRTRVYDAVDALEDAGLVERQHANPQRFRAVPVEEATETLRADYDARIDDLETTLRNVPDATNSDDDSVAEVWSLSGRTAIQNRIQQLIADATDAVVVLATRPDVVTNGAGDEFAAAGNGDVTLAVGCVDTDARDAVRDALPAATVFEPDASWAGASLGDIGAIDCLVFVDGDAVLASATENGDAHAVVGRGEGNALVAMMRGLVAADAPVDV
jgi:sugar-specific transcriptional regulator TrmB